jgi:hypothetical protein
MVTKWVILKWIRIICIDQHRDRKPSRFKVTQDRIREITKEENARKSETIFFENEQIQFLPCCPEDFSMIA